MSRVKRYQNPEVYEALAAEYALGTMKGAALKRFERLIHERPYIRYAVDVWERRLNELGQTAPVIKPPEHVWKNIRQHISPEQETGVVRKARHFWETLGFWQSATVALGVALAVLLLPLQPHKMPMPSYVAVLESSSNEPMVVTMGDAKKHMVSVRLVEKPKMGDGKELELWAIPKNGGDPVSVGVIKTDSMETQLKLSEQHWKRIMGAEMFAITFEDRDKVGSGKPTGPIMYKGQCLDFI